jgi:hypothetical protein
MQSPTQIQISTSAWKIRIETINRGEEICSHHDACRGDNEDVLHSIVLLLVQFTIVSNRQTVPESVNSNTDALNHARVIPVHKLRSNCSRIGSVQLFNKTADCIRRKGYVIVEETKQTTVAIDQIEDRVTCRPEPWVSAEEPHHCRRQIRGNYVENFT